MKTRVRKAREPQRASQPERASVTVGGAYEVARERRARTTVSPAQPYLDLVSVFTSPRATTRSRASVLRLVDTLLNEGHRLHAEERDHLRMLVRAVRDGESTTNERAAANALEKRIDATPMLRGRTRTIDPHRSCQRRDPPALARAELSKALCQWVKAYDTLGPVSDLALVSLLAASGQGPDEAAEALRDAMRTSYGEGELNRNDYKGAKVVEILRSLVGAEENRFPQLRALENPLAPDGEALCRGHSEILRHIRHDARLRAFEAAPELESLLTAPQISAVRALFRRAPIHVRFNPEGVPELLEQQPLWLTRFDTGRTNGNANVVSRHGPEGRLFGLDHDAPAALRPKYGYLNLTNAQAGQAYSFGECVWILKHSVKARSTLCYGDSGRAWPHSMAAFEDDKLDHVIKDLIKIARNPAVLAVATGERESGEWGPATQGAPWLEVQIHGELDLRRDVEALVIPAKIAQTDTGRLLAEAARKHGVDVRLAPAQGLADIGFLAS